MKKGQPILCGLFIALTVGCGQEPAPEPTPPTAPADQALSFTCRTWQSLDSGTTASFRGLSAVSDDVVWVSGTGGTWGRTTDGGDTWTMRQVPGAEELDFRDVDAFGEQTAYLMSAGPGDASRIYKTTDGGETWELQHTNPSPEGFYDGMAFWDAGRGLLYGDPVDGRFVVLATEDGGANWSRVPADGMPPALDGEAGFAASGSGIAVAAGGHAWFGTGGPRARVFHSTDYGRSWTVAETPMLAGQSSAGIFSLDVAPKGHQRKVAPKGHQRKVAPKGHQAVAVGGDYTQPEATAGNFARTSDGGSSWATSDETPAGYRSGVAYAPGVDGRVLVAVGTSGSDLSLDGGQTWIALDMGGSPGGGQMEHYNAVDFGSSTCAAWAAGPEGRLARLAEEAEGPGS